MITDASLRQLHLRLGRGITSNFLGNYATSFVGDGLEFADIRSYAPGDSMKRIDRKTSAKKGELFVKECIQERQLQVWFVDEGKQSYASQVGENMKQLQYALGYAALRNGDRIGVVDHKDTLKLSGKREQLYRLLERTKNSTSQQRSFLDQCAYILLGKRRNKKNSQDADTGDRKQIDSRALLEKKLRQILAMNISGCLIVITSSSLGLPKKLLKQVGYKNEIFFVHAISNAVHTLKSSSPYLSFSGRKSLLVKAVSSPSDGFSPEQRAYNQKVSEHLSDIKRSIQSVGGRYILIHEETDVILSLLNSMSGR